MFFDSRDYLAEELVAILLTLGMEDAAIATNRMIEARAVHMKPGE